MVTQDYRHGCNQKHAACIELHDHHVLQLTGNITRAQVFQLFQITCGLPENHFCGNCCDFLPTRCRLLRPARPTRAGTLAGNVGQDDARPEKTTERRRAPDVTHTVVWETDVAQTLENAIQYQHFRKSRICCSGVRAPDVTHTVIWASIALGSNAGHRIRNHEPQYATNEAKQKAIGNQ